MHLVLFLEICLHLSYCFGHLCAHQSNLYKTPPIPPTALDLLEKEVGKTRTESLYDIEHVVNKVITQKQRSARRKRRTKKNTGAKLTLQERKQQHAKHIFLLLEQQYEHEDLQQNMVTIKLKKVSIRKAINLVSAISGITFLVDSDIQGSVKSFNFKDISLAAALSVLLSNNKPTLALVKDFGVWRIMKREKAVELLVAREEKQKHQLTVVKRVTMFNALWNEPFKKRIQDLWKSMMGKDAQQQGFYLSFDDHGKNIIFRGTKHQVNQFEKWLKDIDVRLPQVRIEARVMLAQKDFERAIGFEWSGVYDRKASIKNFSFAGVGIGKVEGEPTDKFSKLLCWSLNFLPDVMNPFTIKLPFVFGSKDFATKRLNLLLNAAENKEEIQTILKPSLLISNQEMAEILVGEEMPQEVRLQETVEGNPTNITTIGYKDIGMKIKIKPVIAPNLQSVYLDVYIENSQVAKSSIMGTASSGGLISVNQKNGVREPFNYTIQTSRSHSRVLLANGQTTLIGGLIVKTQVNTFTGVPILHKIPVLGWLFKGKRKATLDKQLLIFLTPTLV